MLTEKRKFPCRFSQRLVRLWMQRVSPNSRSFAFNLGVWD